MTDAADVPVVPPEFRRGIVEYAAALAHGSMEDNPELRNFYEERFESRVIALRRLTFTTGRAVRTFDVQGWTA